MHIPIRILVVDDFAPWRRLIEQMLESRPELQIVCGALDGLQAVEKAQELQPDLILLDIGLPKLNGVEAARRILSLAPHSKILFLTQNVSAELARELLLMGGSGYVIKSDAGAELLPAIEAVIQGKQFVSARLANQLSASDEGLDRFRLREVLASFAGRLPRNRESARRHEARFYLDDAIFINELSRVIRAGLDAGDAVLAFATDSHRNGLLDELQRCGVDIQTAMHRGVFRLQDANEAIVPFFVEDWLNPVRYLKGMADAVESAFKAAGAGCHRVAACGELTAPLLASGNVNAVIQVEQLSDAFADEYALDIVCMYSAKMVSADRSGLFEKICAEHSRVHSA